MNRIDKVFDLLRFTKDDDLKIKPQYRELVKGDWIRVKDLNQLNSEVKKELRHYAWILISVIIILIVITIYLMIR